MTSTLRGKRGGGGGNAKNEMFLDVGVGGLESVLDFQFHFVIKENWTCAMTGHYAEPNIDNQSFFDYTTALHCTLFYIRTILSEQKP